jgi:hypothetical protein
MSNDLESIIINIIKVYPSGINIVNITEIVIDIMKQVDIINNMTGIEKKELVLDILNRLIDKTDSGSYDKEIDKILKIMVPTLIDKLVDIDKGKLTISKNVKTFIKLKLCCSYNKRKKK